MVYPIPSPVTVLQGEGFFGCIWHLLKRRKKQTTVVTRNQLETYILEMFALTCGKGAEKVSKVQGENDNKLAARKVKQPLATLLITTILLAASCGNSIEDEIPGLYEVHYPPNHPLVNAMRYEGNPLRDGMTYGYDLKKGGKFRFYANRVNSFSGEWKYVDEHTITLRGKKFNYDGDLQKEGDSRVFRKVR